MFKAVEKETDKIVEVYTTYGEMFLVGDGNGFVYKNMRQYQPIREAVTETPKTSSPAGATVDSPCVFTTFQAQDYDLDALLTGIASEKVPIKRGYSIATKLLDGTDVDFVITDYDDKSIRFESRDCLGKYVPMTKIQQYFDETFEKLPAAFKSRIVLTEREHLNGKGERYMECCKLFLPAASEIFPPEDCYGDKGLYKQMEWYKDIHNRIRALDKGDNDGSDWYWTGSPYAGNTTNWCSVHTAGNAYADYASSAYVAVPICFHIHKIL